PDIFTQGKPVHSGQHDVQHRHVKRLALLEYGQRLFGAGGLVYFVSRHPQIQADDLTDRFFVFHYQNLSHTVSPSSSFNHTHTALNDARILCGTFVAEIKHHVFVAHTHTLNIGVRLSRWIIHHAHTEQQLLRFLAHYAPHVVLHCAHSDVRCFFPFV